MNKTLYLIRYVMVLSLFTHLIGEIVNVPVIEQALATPHEEELEDLLSLLHEETKKITKIHANADYLPGLISIQYGDEMIAQGIETVFDALSLLPGIQTIRSNRGNMEVLFRGMRQSLFGGNALIMLNSVPLMNSTQALALPILSMSTNLVERIEVTRGPGASTQGEYALVGVINVITHKQDKRVAMRAASFESYELAANISQNTGTDLHYFMNLSTRTKQGAGVNSGLDQFGITQGVGYSPGSVDDKEGNQTAILGIQKGRFKATALWSEYRFGNFHGVRALAPRPLKMGSDRQWSINLLNNGPLNHVVHSYIELNAMQYRHDANQNIVAPAGALEGRPPNQILLSTDTTRQNDYTERRYDIKGGINWEISSQHQLSTTAAFSRVNLLYSATTSNFLTLNEILPETLTFSGEQANLPGPQQRRIHSILFQDRFSWNEALSLSASVRYDNYNDLGSYTSPRFSMIWQLQSHHAIKGQYTEAIRPATFSELYGSNRAGGVNRRDLALQIQKSTELAYIYRNLEHIFRSAVFYSKIIDPTLPTGPGNFETAAAIKLKGVELEWQKQINRWHFNTNLSYLDATESGRNITLPGSYQWLANIIVQRKFDKGLQLNSQFRYVSAQVHEGTGIGSVDGYNTFDISLTKIDLMQIKGANLHLGIRNLFDAEIRYSAAPRTYENDLLQPGIAFWTQFELIY